MKAILLCAGYATRLWPLTKNTPKPLLNVGGKPILNYIVEKIEEISNITDVYVVTNQKFYSSFADWKEQQTSRLHFHIVNDQTTSNDDRLGSLGDIRYVVETEKITEDILVVAGDNLFEFSLADIYAFYSSKNKPVVCLYDVGDRELAKLYGIVSVDSENKIIDFEEKPPHPKSTLSSTGVYMYPASTVSQLIEFTKTHDADKAGSFLEWLYTREEVYCSITTKNWLDIGSLEQLDAARKHYGG